MMVFSITNRDFTLAQPPKTLAWLRHWGMLNGHSTHIREAIQPSIKTPFQINNDQ
jgi:hypothetical protein